MKITIEEIPQNEPEEIIIKCHVVNDEILQLIQKIKANEHVLLGYSEKRIVRIDIQSIYYIEAVDNRVFIYCRDSVYESRQKLYELEALLSGQLFIRASKSSILNIKCIKYITPAYNGRFEACLDNGEKQIISRQYVSLLKEKLGI